MKNFVKWSGFAVITVIILFSMAGCASIPEGAEEGTLAPDASSAVICFLQPTMMSGSGDITMWDGETPIGKIKGGLYMNVSYRAKPGVHYFLANRFNWSDAKIDVKANNVYFIKLNWAPNPIPYVNDFVILEVMSKDEGQEQFEKNDKTIVFSDDWRNSFKSSLSQEELAELRKNLDDAKKKK